MSTGDSDSGFGGPVLSVWRNRETLFTGGLLMVIALVAWVAVIQQSAQMQSMSGGNADLNLSSSRPAMPPMDGMTMPMNGSPNATNSTAQMESSPATMAMPLDDGIGYLIAWGVMMTAMMLPSAAPMIALYGAIKRKFAQTGQRGIPTLLFALVYLTLWLVFGIPVYLVSVLINNAVTANPMLASLFPYALAVVLVAAGVFQFTPLKRVCLHGCRTPIAFLLGRWQGGYLGTMKMALEHSAYCIVCCWGLMVVLVAAGAMALRWVLLIAVLVFVEKVSPRGEWTARMIGAALVVLALLVVVQPGLITTLPG
jgi:predicted metal-binding membrane protein